MSGTRLLLLKKDRIAVVYTCGLNNKPFVKNWYYSYFIDHLLEDFEHLVNGKLLCQVTCTVGCVLLLTRFAAVQRLWRGTESNTRELYAFPNSVLNSRSSFKSFLFYFLIC